MTKMFDVCSPRPRKNSEKPYWHRVGTGFEGEKGMNLVLDSLPLPDKDGRVSLFFFEKKEGEARPQEKAKPAKSSSRANDDMDGDSIPF